MFSFYTLLQKKGYGNILKNPGPFKKAMQEMKCYLFARGSGFPASHKARCPLRLRQVVHQVVVAILGPLGPPPNLSKTQEAFFLSDFRHQLDDLGGELVAPQHGSLVRVALVGERTKRSPHARASKPTSYRPVVASCWGSWLGPDRWLPPCLGLDPQQAEEQVCSRQ